MAFSLEDEMEFDDNLGPISEKCTNAINLVIPHQMLISAVYLSIACSYDEEKEMPNFVVFFEDQAEVRRYQAKRFLRYLRNRKSNISLPVIQAPDLYKWENDEQALQSALKAEAKLTKILEDLQTAASEDVDTHLLKFVEGYLTKQKRNTTYLEREITYQKMLEKMKEQERKEEEMREQQRKERERREQEMRKQQTQEQDQGPQEQTQEQDQGPPQRTQEQDLGPQEQTQEQDQGPQEQTQEQDQGPQEQTQEQDPGPQERTQDQDQGLLQQTQEMEHSPEQEVKEMELGQE